MITSRRSSACPLSLETSSLRRPVPASNVVATNPIGLSRSRATAARTPTTPSPAIAHETGPLCPPSWAMMLELFDGRIPVASRNRIPVRTISRIATTHTPNGIRRAAFTDASVPAGQRPRTTRFG